MLKKLFSFNGRIRRTEYGISVIIGTFINGVSRLGIEDGRGGEVLVCLILFVLSMWFLLAQGVKRSHDLGKSGWWIFVPFYGLWLLFAEGDRGFNQYGADPKGRIIENKPQAVVQTQPKPEPEQPKDESIAEPVEKNNFEIAMDYYQGKGVKQSYAEAVFHLKQAVEEGNNDAKSVLASCYYEGKGVEQSYEEAFNLWKDLADNGIVNAMYNVGLCYHNGKGVEPNKDEAITYLRKACELRNDNACALLNKIKKEIENN